jgi:hypothetical protein
VSKVQEEPRYVIPYLLDEMQARQHLIERYGLEVEAQQPLYIPIWAYDTDGYGIYETAEGEKLQVKAMMENIPICATYELEAGILDRLEPYTFYQAKPFDNQYTRACTILQVEYRPQDKFLVKLVNKKVHLTLKTTALTCSGLPEGYPSGKLKTINERTENTHYSLIIVPTYAFKTNRGLWFMNGQTGKIVQSEESAAAYPARPTAYHPILHFLWVFVLCIMLFTAIYYILAMQGIISPAYLPQF